MVNGERIITFFVFFFVKKDVALKTPTLRADSDSCTISYSVIFSDDQNRL